MRPLKTSLSAAGPAPWVRVNYSSLNFAIGCFFIPGSDWNGTAKVQHTPDDPAVKRVITSFTRAGTTVTVVDPDHRASTGDSIVAQLTGSTNLDGEHDITVVDANSYSYEVANSGATTAQPGATLSLLRVYDHATMINMTTRTDGNYAFPVHLIRLNATAWVAGKADLMILQGTGV